MQQRRLILVRHGESLYNQKNLFTGWSDVDLTQQGVLEAKHVGRLLKMHNIYPDLCFCSWLKRAIHTAQIALKELEWEHINMLHSYKLNERHYGAWQGRNKEEIKKEVGKKHFLAVRRGYDISPPLLLEDDIRVPWQEKKYSNIAHNLLPLGESLEDTKRRVLVYYESNIKKALQSVENVLVCAHGNSLRALVMHIESLTPEQVTQLEIPTGEILVYSFDEKISTYTKVILKG